MEIESFRVGSPVKAIVEGSAVMEKEYVLGFGHACTMWFRPDLEPVPEGTKRVAEVLRAAGIEVRKVHGGWLECEPRPAGISEALSGQLAEPHWVKQCNCPPEEPGQVLKLLADKGIPVTG